LTCSIGPIDRACLRKLISKNDAVYGFLILPRGEAGFKLLRRPIAERRVQPLLVVDLLQELANRRAGLGQIAVFVAMVEWPGALQSRALPEPDVNLSIHPAPIIGPLVPSSNVRTVPDRGV